MSTQPELKETFLRHERQRWKQRVEEGKINQIKDEGSRTVGKGK